MAIQPCVSGESFAITGIGTCNYLNLWKIRRLIAPRETDCLFELGSGTGRVVCWFGLLRLRRVVGIELIPELCSVARENANRLRWRNSPLEIFQGDFTKADLTDATIIFLFNPCNESTFRVLVSRIQESIENNPRELVIYYHKPVHRHVLDETSWLQKVGEYRGCLGITMGLSISTTRQRDAV